MELAQGGDIYEHLIDKIHVSNCNAKGNGQIFTDSIAIVQRTRGEETLPAASLSHGLCS